MNYGDPQQQQYITQRMANGQRIPMSINQQGMQISQQQIRSQQQPINSGQYSLHQITSTTQHPQLMQRMPVTNQPMPTASNQPSGMMYRQQHVPTDTQSDLLNQLPPEIRMQIQNETDSERKKIIFQNALRRQHMEQQQRQQQMSVGAGMHAGGGMLHMQHQQRITANVIAQQQHMTSQNSMMYNVGNSTSVNSNVSGSMIGTASQSTMNTATSNQISAHHQQINGSVHMQRVSSQVGFNSIDSNQLNHSQSLMQQQISSNNLQNAQINSQQQTAQPLMYATQRGAPVSTTVSQLNNNSGFVHQNSGIVQNVTSSAPITTNNQQQMNQITLQQINSQQQQQFLQQHQFLQQQHQFQQIPQQNMHISQHQHLHQHSQQQNQSSLQNQPQQQILLQPQQQVLHSSQPQSQQHHISSGVGVVNHHISNISSVVMGQQDSSNRSSVNASNLQPYLHQISQHTTLGPQSVSQQHQQQLRSISSNQQVIGSSPIQSTGPASVKPATPSNRSVSSVNGPNLVTNSTGTTQVSEQQQQQPEYKAALEQLKSYHAFCKRFIMRLRVDGSQSSHLEKSVERVIEIIEGRRIVDLKLIERLVKNVRTTMVNNDPMRGILELLRRLYLNNELEVQPVYNILPDIWHDVKHMQIKVPDHITALIKFKEEEMIANNVDLLK